MKNPASLINKVIVNDQTGDRRFVTDVNEQTRRISWVPDELRDIEPMTMAFASYDRRWSVLETETAETETPAEPETETPAEPETETPAEPETETPAEPETETPAEPETEVMEMGKTIGQLETIFDKLNAIYFEGKLPRPVITVQTTPKAYGHCSVKKIWTSETGAQYEINLGAEYINRPKELTCCTLLHEMVHLFCNENQIVDTCQGGRYHNKNFRAECEARDLAVDYDRTNGHAYTSPTDAFKAKLAAAGIDLSVRFARILPTMPKRRGGATATGGAEPDGENEGEAPARKKSRRYVCPCCGQTVRSTQELNIICGICNEKMTCGE